MTQERQGELFQLAGVFMWAFFPIVTILSYSSLPALMSLGWSTLFAAVFFLVLVVVRGRLHELRNPLLWKYVLGIVIFIGVIFYALSFIGLKTTTSGNASLIALVQILSGYVFFNIFKKEFFSKERIIGTLLMLVGAAIVLSSGYSGVHRGDLLILIAVVISPLGDYFQKKARSVASSETVMFLRSILTVPVIFLLAYGMGERNPGSAIVHALPLLLINGVLLFGVSKVFWLEAIHRISVTKAYALSGIGPLFTLLFAWMILRQPPTVWQLLAFVPFCLGILFLTDGLRLPGKKGTEA